MTQKIIFEVDGVALPTPSSIQVTLADTDGQGSGTNAKGYTRRKRLRKGVRQLEINYLFLTSEESKTILDALDPVFVNVRYIDPQFGAVTKTMYVTDRALPMYGKDYQGNLRWQNLSFTLVEE